jgi:thioesterase domain-containing protein
MAERYLDEVLAHKPAGPLHLAGYSMGAFIAFEMARIARSRGRELGLLAAIDDGPALLKVRPEMTWSELAGFVTNVPCWLDHQVTHRRWNEFLGDALRKLRTWISQLIHRGRGPNLDAVLDSRNYSDVQRKLMTAHYAALRRYSPQSYDGPMTVFRARVQPLFGSHQADLGWRNVVSGELWIKTVAGNHDSIISEPSVAHLATALTASLEFQSLRAAA